AEGTIRHLDTARDGGVPRGQRPRARTETPRTRTGRSPGCPQQWLPWAASGSLSTHADDERAGEIGQAGSTDEVAEQRRATGRGGDGGKRSGQRKPATAKRAPDTEPGGRAQCAGAGTASGKTGQEAAVHGAPASQLRHPSSAGGVSRAEARGRAGRGWRDVAALRRGAGGTPPRLVRAAEAGGVPSEAGSSGVHLEGRRAAAAARCSRAGGQNRSARHRRGAQRHLRDGLPRLLVRVPSGAWSAQRAGCALYGAADEEGELGARRG